MTAESRYTIGKLAEAAGVTPRTIRYYTAEGLLPPPQAEGRYALYTDAHRDRLRLIQRLKDAYLPLATIRTQLAGLSDAQVQALLEKCPPAPPDAPKPHVRMHVRATEPHAQQSHLEYIAQILAVTGQATESAPPASPPKRALLVSPVLGRGEGETETRGAAEEQKTEVAPISQAETWERVPLASGVELHLRAPITSEDRERLARLIAAARALFGSTDSE